MELIQDEIEKNKEYLESQKIYRDDLEKQYSQIINSKFYIIWQKINKIKKYIIKNRK